MASIQTNYTQDQNWEGEIRINYHSTQNQAGNYSVVYIDSVQFRSNVNGEGWGRSSQWSVYGDILFSGHDYFTFSGERFNTYGSDWVTLGNGRSTQFNVYHDNNGYGDFDVVFQGVGSYNDFNVFNSDGVSSHNCEITGGTTITANLPRIVPDTSAPVIDLSVSVTDLGAATLSANASVDCSSWQYQVDGGSWVSISGTGTSKTVSLSGMTGTHSYRVRATKRSNNVTGYSSTVTKTTDTAAPTVSLSVSVTDLGVATLSASANASCGSWAYQIDGGNWVSIAGTGSSKTATVQNMTGTHTYRVRATKTNNNQTGYSSAVTKTTDTAAPSISLTASVNSSGTVTLTATANASCSGWSYSIDGGSWNASTGTATSKTFSIPGMTGRHNFQVRATKASNNVTGTSSAVTTTTPVLGLSSTNVSTSGSLDITVQDLPANTYVYLKYGNTVLDSYRYGSAQERKVITLTAADQKALFTASGVTTQQSITVTASVDGYSYTAASFTLTSGSNMSPTVGTPTATIVQGSTVDSSLANVYIAGISKVKIAASVSAGSGSTIQSVRATYGDKILPMGYNSSTGEYEATTYGPITGDTTFTVTATDQRGLTGSGTVSVTGVKSWSAPAITIYPNYTYRCNASGVKTEGGEYVRVRAGVSYSTSVTGNALRDLYFYIKEEGERTDWTLTNNTQSPARELTDPNPNRTITVVVKGRDMVGDFVTKEMQLGGAHRDFALASYSGTTAGKRVTALGIGKAPDPTIDAALYGSTVQLPLMGRFLVGDVEIQNYTGADIYEDAVNSGLWNGDFLAHDEKDPMAEVNKTVQFSISDFSGWTNLPSAVLSENSWEGVRFIILTKSHVYALAVERYPISGRIWCNDKIKDVEHFYFNWRGWKGHTPDIT